LGNNIGCSRRWKDGGLNDYVTEWFE